MKLIDRQLQDYLAQVASDAPAPGGGSASALCGAQGIGLVAMVARLTAGKAKFAAFHPVCKAVAADADGLCGQLAAQVDLDTEAYGRIAQAFRLPKETEGEKAARGQAVADATLHATEVPLETMRLGMQGLECAQRLLGHYNTNCASDVGCGAYGLLCCVRGAWLNVLINVGGLPEGDAAKLKQEGAALMDRVEKLAADLDVQIKASL